MADKTPTFTIVSLDHILVAVVPTGEDVEAAIQTEEKNANVEFSREDLDIVENAKHVGYVDAYPPRDWIFWGRDRSGYVRCDSREVSK